VSFTTELQDLKSKIEALIAAGGIVEPSLINQLAAINQALNASSSGGTTPADIGAGIDLSADVEAIKTSLSAIESVGFTPSFSASAINAAGDNVIVSPTGVTIAVYGIGMQNAVETAQTAILKYNTTVFGLWDFPANDVGFGVFLPMPTPLIVPSGQQLIISLAAATSINITILADAV